MSFSGVLWLVLIGGVLAVLIVFGASVRHAKYLSLWTILLTPLWIITLLIFAPLFWPMEGDYSEGGGAPWGSYFIGLPLGALSFATAAPVGSAWAARLIHKLRNSTHSQTIEEEN